jgi:hypothetical protein
MVDLLGFLFSLASLRMVSDVLVRCGGREDFSPKPTSLSAFAKVW